MVPKRQRWLAVVTLTVGVLVLSVGGVAVMANRQTVTTVDDAVADFRADGSTAPSQATPDASTPSASPPSSEASASAIAPSTGTPDGPARETATSEAGDAPAEPQSGSLPQQQTSTPGSEPPREGAAEAQPHLTVPDEGVYTYATDGGESVDALGGARHEYPDRTTITVRHTGCGYTARWEPLRERWEEFDICRAEDRAWMRTITLYHEFFGRGMRHDYTCGDAATIAEASSEPGQRWSWDCHSDGGSMHTVIEVVEFATRDVGGQPVEAVHVLIHNTMEGDTRGTREADVWYDRWSGLELSGTYDTDTTVDTPMGPSRYVERFSRTLTDLQPRR